MKGGGTNGKKEKKKKWSTKRGNNRGSHCKGDLGGRGKKMLALYGKRNPTKECS